ncbi:MAG: 5'/3'-nucleotidase SurE [Simkaniaceae bacterium]|nr:5'/3'-nucleotidase SurE [Candidatus Sacchlamyda saccharinae]
MNRKPKILITNDDGITASGIWHLWHALHEKADLTIVAPMIQKSGTGLGLTLHKPITINPVKWEKNARAWKVSGTPADCVRFGLRIVLDEKPDLIVSGINKGSNAGRNVLYSGTMGGVIEGAMKDIPGIAFSCVEFEEPRYEAAESYIYPIVEHILEHPLSKGTVLNVNFPCKFENFKGVKLARQGQSLWVEDPDERVHPDGEPYFWHGGQWSDHDEHEDSDVALLAQGYVTAVPIHVHELTDHGFFQERKSHFDNKFGDIS